MVNEQVCRKLALSFPQVSEKTHFEKLSFRTNNKIFATLNLKENRICVKLPEIEQDIFSSFDKDIIWPVPNKWGKMGWTLVNLAEISEDMLLDILRTAYCEVAPKRLADQVNNPDELDDYEFS